MSAYDDVALRSINLSAIVIRREEANGCSNLRLYNAATLTAGSAIELLLDILVERLIEKLLIEDPDEAAKISQRRTALENQHINKRITFLDWIRLYSELDLARQFRLHYGREFAFLNKSKLNKVREHWNRVKHEHHRVRPTEASQIVSYMNDALEEAEIKTKNGTTEFSFIGQQNVTWQQSWKKKIERWVSQHPGLPEENLLLYLPLLLGLVINLVGDRRVSFSQKSSLLVAANYVFSTEDLISEKVHNVRGLVDDVAVLVFSLNWLRKGGDLDETIMRECWNNPTDIISYIAEQEQYIRDNHAKLFRGSPNEFGSNLVWATIQRISTGGPEALWQNYWKEAY